MILQNIQPKKVLGDYVQVLPEDRGEHGAKTYLFTVIERSIDSNGVTSRCKTTTTQKLTIRQANRLRSSGATVIPQKGTVILTLAGSGRANTRIAKEGSTRVLILED